MRLDNYLLDGPLARIRTASFRIQTDPKHRVRDEHSGLVTALDPAQSNTSSGEMHAKMLSSEDLPDAKAADPLRLTAGAGAPHGLHWHPGAGSLKCGKGPKGPHTARASSISPKVWHVAGRIYDLTVTGAYIHPAPDAVGVCSSISVPRATRELSPRVEREHVTAASGVRPGCCAARRPSRSDG